MDKLNNLDGMKYSELQQLAKQFGIKANMKANKLKQALAEYKRNQCAAAEEPEPMSLDVVASPAQCEADAAEETSTDVADMASVCVEDKVDAGHNVSQRDDAVVSERNETVDEATEGAVSVIPDVDAERSLHGNEMDVVSGGPLPTEPPADDGTAADDEDLEIFLPDPEITINVRQSSAGTRRRTFDADDAKPLIKSSTKTSNSSSSTKKMHKDWAAIHKKEFDKMESLDEFLAKRRQRHRVLKTPPKRAAALAASLKLPDQKPVDTSRLGAAALAKPLVFAPTVMSTSCIKTNFLSMYKTPSASAAKIPFKLGTSALKSVNGKENTGTSAKRKSIVSKQTATTTPAVGAADKSLLSTSSLTAKKPTFDLKTSLARPLAYTPHQGKLQPFTFGKVDVKAVKTKTREVRREEMKADRMRQRMAVQMKRRQ